MTDPASRALLVLADGTHYEGKAYGAVGRALGTLRLSVEPTGYQETLTDASASTDIIVFTSPHIGVVGVNDDDARTARIQAAGLIVRDPARRASNFRAQRNLTDDLARDEIVGISDVDTRAIARRVASAADPLIAGIFSGPDADLPLAEITQIVSNHQ